MSIPKFHEGSWFPTRGVNGEHGWLNIQTGEFTTVNPLTQLLQPKVQQSTTVKKIIKPKTRTMAEVATERAMREREQRRKYDAEHGKGTYNAKKDQEATQMAILKAQQEQGKSLAGYAADAIDGAMLGVSMIPGYGSLLGGTYWTAKGAKNLSQGNYLNGAIDLIPAFTAARAAQPVVIAGVEEMKAPVVRFLLDMSDRHKGLIYAQLVQNGLGNFYTSAFARAGSKWGLKYGILSLPNGERAGTANGGQMFAIQDVNEIVHPIIESQGKATVSIHLGGPMTSLTNVNHMPLSWRAATNRFIHELPTGTQITESGMTVPFAELYFGTKPSWLKSFYDAVRNKRMVNPKYESMEQVAKNLKYNPGYKHFTEEEGKELLRMAAENEPLSMDSYKQAILFGEHGKFGLTYDSTPMGFFNPLGLDKEFYNYIKNLPIDEQLTAINDWIRSFSSKTRLAYIKNGKIQIPRPINVKK